MLALVGTKEDDVKNAVTDAYRSIFINVPQVEEPTVEVPKVHSKRLVFAGLSSNLYSTYSILLFTSTTCIRFRKTPDDIVDSLSSIVYGATVGQLTSLECLVRL